jgi:hypothetical protein
MLTQAGNYLSKYSNIEVKPLAIMRVYPEFLVPVENEWFYMPTEQ